MDSEQQAEERRWAQARYRDYLLDRINEADAERMHLCLALLPDLCYELDEAESTLIRQGLKHQLPAQQQADFEKRYISGSEHDRIKVILERALELEPHPATSIEKAWEPVRRNQRPFTPIIAVAACLLMALFAGLWYFQRLKTAELNDRVAKLLREKDAKQKGSEAKNDSPVPPRKSPPGPVERTEQPAGETADGFLLPAGRSGMQLRATSAPVQLIWSPVPDYRLDYRIGLRYPDGQVETSPPLTPRNNAIAFSPEGGTRKAPLPWIVEILSMDSSSRQVIAQYSILPVQ